MNFPLYEYDQVITMSELILIARSLSDSYRALSRWRILDRFRLYVQLQAIMALIDGLHMKPSVVQELRSQSQGESR